MEGVRGAVGEAGEARCIEVPALAVASSRVDLSQSSSFLRVQHHACSKEEEIRIK